MSEQGQEAAGHSAQGKKRHQHLPTGETWRLGVLGVGVWSLGIKEWIKAHG